MMKRNKTLQVKFSLASLDRDVDLFRYFCFPAPGEWDWSEKIFSVHPELKEILKGKTLRNSHSLIKQYVRVNRQEHQEEVLSLVGRYQRTWEQVGNDYLTLLSGHFETTFPKEPQTIRAYISIVPIFPRDLDAWSFHVGTDEHGMLPIAFHELLHFFYFKKWMEVFPETKREELDSPHLVWKLSEILAPIILNLNPDIQKISPVRHGQYDEFAHIRVGEQLLVDRFAALYNAHLRSGESFGIFLTDAWNEAKKQEKLLS